RGVVIDKNGNVFVSIFTNNTISKITPAGSVTNLFARAQAYGIAIDKAGDLFTTDYVGGALRKITALGVVTWHQFNLGYPYAIAVDDSGILYVTINRLNNSSIIKINHSGDTTQIAKGIENPYSMAIDKNKNLFVADMVGGTLTKVYPDGKKTEIARGFSYPTGLAVAPDGIIYVVNSTGSVSKVTLQ
ncbi:MAG: hypothetical protein WKF91_02755, partial [Segetibacter sp.]